MKYVIVKKLVIWQLFPNILRMIVGYIPDKVVYIPNNVLHIPNNLGYMPDKLVYANLRCFIYKIR